MTLADRSERRGDAVPGHADALVLIVDDQPLNIALLEAILRKNGFRRFATTTDPSRAAGLYRRDRPDLVLLDLVMPGMDGFAVMRQLRALEPPGTVPPILVLTADGDPAVKLRALEEGAQDFVTKPFHPVEVVRRARNLVATRLLQQRLTAQNRTLAAEIARRTGRLEGAVEVLKLAEQRLSDALAEAQAASQAKSEFIANLSHELRTPLNAILGFSEVVMTEALGPIGVPRYREYGADIHGAGQHLLRIVNDLLDISRAEAGRLDLEIADVDMREAAAESLKLLAPLAEKGGIALAVDFPADFPILRTDRQKLQQVLVNIVSNAIKFTPAGGSVTVRGRTDPVQGALILVVSDSGIGIAPEDLSLVMSPYGQARGAQKRGGTGLGLPLTKRFVEALGASLDLQSTPGVGTVVTIKFPPNLIAAAR